MEEKNLIKAWMPIKKEVDGTYSGILSDTSLDRDNEFMTRELLEDWASSSDSLPMLANHENKMEKFVGGWKNKKVISKGSNHALIATPFFFSKEANPLAAQIKKQIEEAVEHGLGVGISIGAIPSETVEKEVNGIMRTGYSKAEIVEATVVPIQSNRNASFTAIAKSFGINDKKVNGDEKMSEELKYSQKAFDNAISKIKKEADEKVAEAEAKVTEAEAKTEEVEAKVEEAESKVEEAEKEKTELEEAKDKAEEVLESEKKKNSELTKEIEKLKKFTGVDNLPNTDVPTGDYSSKGLNDDSEPITFEKLLGRRYEQKKGE